MNPVRISGTLEAIGQHTFTEKEHTYAYLRFLDSAGKVVTKEKVVVQNGCNSYLHPDLQGDFYFADFGKLFALYGLKVNGRSVSDVDQVDKDVEQLKALGCLCFILGIPLLIIIVGVLLMYAGCQMFWGAVKGPKREQMIALMNE